MSAIHISNRISPVEIDTCFKNYLYVGSQKSFPKQYRTFCAQAFIKDSTYVTYYQNKCLKIHFQFWYVFSNLLNFKALHDRRIVCIQTAFVCILTAFVYKQRCLYTNSVNRLELLISFHFLATRNFKLFQRENYYF